MVSVAVLDSPEASEMLAGLAAMEMLEGVTAWLTAADVLPVKLGSPP